MEIELHSFGFMIEAEFLASWKTLKALSVNDKAAKSNSGVATHCRVSLISGKEYTEMCFTVLFEFGIVTKNGAVHLAMAAGFPHELLADVVILVLGLSALFEKRAFE